MPTSRTGSGYRSCTASDVDRPHRVLLHHGLGLRLEEIATLLDDPTVDARAHLLRQRELLGERIARLDRMAAAAEEVLEAHTVGTRLSTEAQAEIFGDGWLGEECSAEAEQRWGATGAWVRSQRRTAVFTGADWQRVEDETDALEAALARALRDGVAPGSVRANALAEEHRASIDRVHDCDHAMQVCLATTYVTDPRLTARTTPRGSPAGRSGCTTPWWPARRPTGSEHARRGSGSGAGLLGVERRCGVPPLSPGRPLSRPRAAAAA